jgi:hypothetical protein
MRQRQVIIKTQRRHQERAVKGHDRHQVTAETKDSSSEDRDFKREHEGIHA